MQITTQNTTIEYSITDHGHFAQTVRSSLGILRRTTPKIQKFIGWMIGPRESQEEMISRMIGWWEMPGGYSRGGNFNVELYNKVKIAKQKLRK